MADWKEHSKHRDERRGLVAVGHLSMDAAQTAVLRSRASMAAQQLFSDPEGEHAAAARYHR